MNLSIKNPIYIDFKSDRAGAEVRNISAKSSKEGIQLRELRAKPMCPRIKKPEKLNLFLVRLTDHLVC